MVSDFAKQFCQNRSRRVGLWPVWLNCRSLKLMSGKQLSVFWAFPVSDRPRLPRPSRKQSSTVIRRQTSCSRAAGRSLSRRFAWQSSFSLQSFHWCTEPCSMIWAFEAFRHSIVVRRVGAPYRRVRIPGSSDLRVCVLSANKDIAPRTRCFHLIIQQAIHWQFHVLF